MGWVRAAQLGTASTPGEHKVSREQGVGCRRDGPPPRPSASPLRLAPPPRPSASLRATLTLPPPPTQLSYEGEDAAEPTWDHPHVRQGGWRFERVREGRRLAADIRTVASRRQSAADGARPRLLKRPWEGPERGLRTAWRGGEPPTRMACWSLGGGGGGGAGLQWGVAGATGLAPPRRRRHSSRTPRQARARAVARCGRHRLCRSVTFDGFERALRAKGAIGRYHRG